MERLLELTVNNKLGHLSSTLTTLPILEHIFKKERRRSRNIVKWTRWSIVVYNSRKNMDMMPNKCMKILVFIRTGTRKETYMQAPVH